MVWLFLELIARIAWLSGVLNSKRMLTVTKYSDVADTGLCKLLTLATETGGRCNKSATDLIDRLSTYKAEYAPRVIAASAVTITTIIATFGAVRQTQRNSLSYKEKYAELWS